MESAQKAKPVYIRFKNISDIPLRIPGCGCQWFDPGKIATVPERFLADVNTKQWTRVDGDVGFDPREEVKSDAAAARKTKPAKAEGK